VYYFFRFGDKSKSSLSACLRAIALQTAEQLPEFRRVLEDTLFTTTKLEKADAKTIWEKIFLGVLFKTKITKTIYWIIDAIDESDQPRRFLDLIQSIAQSSVPIRILLVSHSTRELILSFDRLSKFVPVAYLPLEDTQKDIQKDIRIYVEKEVQSMHTSAEFKSNVVKKMIERANGIFLWVSLVVSEAMECYSQEHLEDTLDTIPSGMEALYQRMESTIIENTGPRYEKLGQIILTWVVCARRPLLVKELEQALQPKFVLQDLNLTLGRVCGQFVVINSTDQVVMVHKTARDYIVATNSALRLDLAEGHEMLFTKCLTLLIENHSSRKSNRQPTSLKDQHLLRYAMISWPYHLDMASAQSDGPLLLLSKFLKGNSVLGWIASLAYGNELNVLVSSAQSLNLYIRRKRSHYAAVNPWLRQLRELELLESWATDFVKILGKFGRTLTADPTSIYRQIPPFCPENSMIYRQFAKSTSPPHLSVEGVSKLIWDDSMAKLSLGPGSNNRTVICSGELFAVLTAAGVIVLSSSVTFDILHSLSHTERVSAMSFSTCSNMLVTYGFRTTKVWSVKTGHIIYQIQNPLGSRALTIAFSAENTELVMGSDDGSIRVARLTIASPAWSVSHQRLLKDDTDSDRQIFNRPRCMSFNSDVSCVAITFRGAPLCVWGLDPQELIGKCIGNQEHEGTSWKAVEQVLWHPNAEEVQVLGLYVGGDIFRWNPYFNTPQELQAHASILALSPEGNVFATGDHNGTIKLYDFHNFALIYQLSYADMINDICFSPDSKRLYDVRGQFCNIWEPQVLIRIDGTSEEDSGYGSEMPSVSSIIDLQQPRDPITALAIQFRGRYHAIGNAAGIVSVVDSLEGNGVAVELWRSQTMLPIEHLGWSGDGNYLACVETGGRIVIIHLQLRSDHQLGSFHTQPIAARPTDPKMSSKGIKQILLNSDGKALLVKYGPVTILSQIVNGTRIDEKSITSPDMKWFKHPTYSTLLLAFSPSILQVHRWDDLSTVAVFNMDEHSTSVIQRSQHTKEAPGDVRISSVFTDPAGSRFLMDVVVETSRGEAHFTSSFVESIFLKQPTGRNPVSIITPIPIPPEVQQRIERPLGILPSKGLIFLDKDYWVCSWGDSKPGAEIIQRHFFLPKDWLNEECVDLCALLADGTFLIPHDGDLALIKSAGMLLHMDRPHKGKKNTEDTMKTEDAPMSQRGEKNTRDMIEMELPLVSYTETGTAEDTMETEPAPGLVLEPPVKSDVDEGCENEDPIIRQESTDPHITSPQSVVACESYQEIAPTHFASEAFVSEAVLELMPELSGAFVKDESTGPDDHLTKGDCSSGKLAEVLEVVDTNSGSSTGQSWENLAELNESQSMIENRLLDGHLLVMRNKIHKRIARYLRPRVKAGYRRLEWQCVRRPFRRLGNYF
jgi:WD40 repeat protein